MLEEEFKSYKRAYIQKYVLPPASYLYSPAQKPPLCRVLCSLTNTAFDKMAASPTVHIVSYFAFY